MLDNAKNNNSAMHELSHLLMEWDIIFDPVDQRIMCFPHILNICVKHVIDKHKTADFSRVPSSWVSTNGQTIKKVDYVEALCSVPDGHPDPVALCHDIVRTIHASGLRHQGFCDMIEHSNKMDWFKDEKSK